MIVNGSDQLVLEASETLYINGLDIEGTYKTIDGKRQNAKVLYDAKNIVIKNVNCKGTIYNALEQSGSPKFPIESMKLSNIIAKDISIKHNIINAYKFANNANVLVEDSNFNLCVSNSNVARFANIDNATGVTVKFKNVNWTYENANKPADDIQYAALLLFQPWPSASDKAYKAVDLSPIKSWKFIFENCSYNGTKITENNFGEISQIMYGYSMDSTGKGITNVSEVLDIEII